MKNGIQVAVAFCVASLGMSAAVPAAPPPQEEPGGQLSSPLVSPEPPAWEDRSLQKIATGEGFDAVEVLRIVTDLSRDASVDEVELALFELMPQIYRASNQDLSVVGEVIAGLRRQPGAVEALALHYQQLPPEAFEQRLLAVGILGELQRPDAAAPLHEVVWAPLPAPESLPEALSERDLEEMIQAKAVHGLAYLKTPATDEAVRDVIVHHESLHVQASAIDAYMWNHGDSRQTADELYGLLPEEMHPYVERPRFHADMDPEEFSRRLGAWRKRWATEPAQTLDADPKGESK